MKIVFEQDALGEYLDAVRHSEERFGLGRSFVAAVDNSLSSIASNPDGYKEVGMGIRIFRMKRFPFYLFYHSSDSVITLYAVAHHARRPGYWRDRVPPAG